GLATTTSIHSVAALAPNDVWWIYEGNNSVAQGFLHWDGASLTVTPLDESAQGDTCCPFIAGATIIDGRWWLVARGGSLYTKVDANALHPLVGTTVLGWGMWGTSDSDMYFSGGGSINHWDGTTMTRIPLPTSAGTVTGVAGAGLGGANELW